MSGSETGVMTSSAGDPIGVGLQKTEVTSEPTTENMCLASSADGTAVCKPEAADTSPSYQTTPSDAIGGGGGGVEGPAAEDAVSPHGINVNMNMGSASEKKKRGRPRKYGPDGTMALALVPASQAVTQTTGGGSSSPHPPDGAAVTRPVALGESVSPIGSKKARGRPPGSSKKQQLEALGLAGVGFTPYVIYVKAGEDVSAKILSFAPRGPRAFCILSGHGAVSNVTLRQQATSGGTVTYEGRFEILSLCGSFMPFENGGRRSRTGGLSVSLSGPDGRVLGGSVAGLIIAASPVQVVMASFKSDGRKESKSANQVEPSSAMMKFAPALGTTGPSSPPSGGTHSESSGGPGSPLNQNTGACNSSNPQGI